MTYDDLVLVNRQLETVGLDRKTKTGEIVTTQYAPVHERVEAFRMLFPEGKLITEIERLEDGFCLIRADAYSAEGNLLASAHAYEKEGASFINKTSYIENCETSAVGRCLGFLGIGIGGSIASKEEVEHAQEQQAIMERVVLADEPIDEKHFRVLKKRFNEAGIRLKDVMDHYGIERPTQITYGLERIINSEFDALAEELKK